VRTATIAQDNGKMYVSLPFSHADGRPKKSFEFGIIVRLEMVAKMVADSASSARVAELAAQTRKWLDSQLNRPPISMARVALADDTSSFKRLQSAINSLAHKASDRRPRSEWTADEMEFLVGVFDGLFLGGSAKGFSEAAALARHYVSGGGELLKVDENVYRDSRIVRDTAKQIRQYLAAQKLQYGHCDKIVTTRPRKVNPKQKQLTPYCGRFLDSRFAKPLRKSDPDSGIRSSSSDGCLQSDGALLAEQENKRLHYADNRFYLDCYVYGSSSLLWRVESIYDFEPYPSGLVTKIPLGVKTLQVPDGLSSYMTVLGIAKVFWYYAEWTEIWKS